ncbi:hypothetical protein [Amycolatopsis samaneae]|uniref:Uncharacterized protein n=1 Tax=Amycolatopsis samaneae TaxID=664691 RepID=A0ABW5GFU9_9PSEU
MSDACERIKDIMRPKGFDTVSRSEAIAVSDACERTMDIMRLKGFDTVSRSEATA